MDKASRLFHSFRFGIKEPKNKTSIVVDEGYPFKEFSIVNEC